MTQLRELGIGLLVLAGAMSLTYEGSKRADHMRIKNLPQVFDRKSNPALFESRSKAIAWTDVDYAKKHIDPAHPKSGPYGIDAKDDPSVKQTATSTAVTFGGNLSSLNAKQDQTGDQTGADPNAATIPEPSGRAIGGNWTFRPDIGAQSHRRFPRP